MRRILIVLFELLVFVWAIEVLADGSFLIKGYKLGQFEVDDEILAQFNEKFPQIQNDPAKKPNTTLKVLVIGSADNTGPSAKNGLLSDQRAKPIASLIEDRSPIGSIVNVLPRGDSENERKVRVQWKYVPIAVAPAPVAPAPVSEKGKFDTFGYWFFGGGLLLVVIVFIYAAWKARIGMKKPFDKTETRPLDTVRWLDIVVNGRKFSIQVEFKNGKFTSPFKQGNGLPIVRDTLKRIQDSLKGCLTKEEFMRQAQELFARGKIKELNQ